MMHKLVKLTSVVFLLGVAAASFPQDVQFNHTCLINAGNCKTEANTCPLGGTWCYRCSEWQPYSLCVPNAQKDCRILLSFWCGDKERRGCDENNNCIGAWIKIGFCDLDPIACEDVVYPWE